MTIQIGNLNFCRVCGGKNIEQFFDLGKQPPANSLLRNSGDKEDFYPLALSWCRDCNLVQLNYTADPEKLFSQYVWVTATSQTARYFSETFYKELVSRARSGKNGYVLEIASNDGTFLLPFIKNGYKVLGIDPARNIAKIAEGNGVPTKCVFFGRETAEDIVKEKGMAEMVFARNVLPHVANTRDFVNGLQYCLSQDGVLAVEVHYAGKILDELHYDSIYHEHLCYFTFKSLERLLNDFNLFVFDIGMSPISGGSLVIYAKKGKVEEKSSVQLYRDREKGDRINDLAKWKEFAEKSVSHREKFLSILDNFAKEEKKVVGYGASARSSTMLNFCGIGPQQLSVIADQNPLKQNLFTAGTHIKIKDPKDVMIEKPDYVLILAWNFAEEIIKNLKEKFSYKGGVIIPLPNDIKILEKV
jgi:hypothetical protein